METVEIIVRLAPPPGLVAPVEAHAEPADTVEWKIENGSGRVQFLGFPPGSTAPVSFSQNTAMPGSPATGTVNNMPGRWAYVIYGYESGQYPDSAPIPPGAAPLSVAAVMIVERLSPS